MFKFLDSNDRERDCHLKRHSKTAHRLGRINPLRVWCYNVHGGAPSIFYLNTPNFFHAIGCLPSRSDPSEIPAEPEFSGMALHPNWTRFPVQPIARASVSSHGHRGPSSWQRYCTAACLKFISSEMPISGT